MPTSDLSFSYFTIKYFSLRSKGRTIRKVMGGRGIFSLQDFFFSPSACAGIFFARETLCTNFFFQTNIALFVVYVLTSWSARALEPEDFPEQACAMVFSPEVAITIFSCLISPNLAGQPIFKFLRLTENTKTET